ncbi:hypothetical protein CYLTODRAFT_407797 [Cylindrobasidium torrendii FP15055 ss-10]|uniref:Uncharacterized protein n=1 Tax=Cylindrobasidium torrendii FP15055 ss-10 TaxID=1314674 RepID=A0A0D7BN33_9AGAR|nr:hypothetical protein CYLTODRAFT_407797 [Cylindrobasidium torrendii FP15055 ss-10]
MCSLADSPSLESTSSSVNFHESVGTSHNTSLLTQSLSYESLSSLSTDLPIPPFPFGSTIPLQIVIGAKSRLAGLAEATTTVPTPPRLRTVPRETLSVKRWMEAVSADHSPLMGHVPWGELEDGETNTWIAEGSLFSPDDFKDNLRAARKSPQTSNHLDELTPVRRGSRARTSHRDALVFQRDITFATDGGNKRWSVQIPARQLDSETADMMFELRKLNAFFSSTAENPEALARESLLTQPLMDVEPPSLMISTSQCMMPLSLESTTSVKASTTLAARRQKAVAPLDLYEINMREAFPDVPTAYLGTTASRASDTSHSEGNTPASTATSERPSLNLKDMIGSLRSHCASMQVKTPPSADLQPPFVEQQVSREPGDTSDEWAFTDGLATAFSPISATAITPTTAQDPTYSEMLTASPEDNMASPSMPPAVPLPVCPSSTSPTPRGILKRCKSVRFASESQEVTLVEGHLKTPKLGGPPRPRHSTGSTSQAKPAFSLIRTVAPKCTVIPPQNQSPSKTPKPFLSAAGRRLPGSGRYASTELPQRPASTPPRRAPTPLASKSPPRPPVVRPSIPLPVKAPRPTTLPSSPARIRQEKENTSASNVKGGVAFGTALKSRFTLDENVMRRGLSENDQRKSRMPAPFKNMLTRFK